jgi:hypothetical protein
VWQCSSSSRKEPRQKKKLRRPRALHTSVTPLLLRALHTSVTPLLLLALCGSCWQLCHSQPFRPSYLTCPSPLSPPGLCCSAHGPACRHNSIIFCALCAGLSHQSALIMLNFTICVSCTNIGCSQIESPQHAAAGTAGTLFNCLKLNEIWPAAA